MRKVVLIIGLLLLMQLAWVPASYAGPPPAGGFWHTVRWGETLFSIGRAFGVNPYSICHTNGLHNCNYVWAGQSLWIPAGYSGPGGYPGHDGYSGCSARYTVHWGDTLYSIGRRYGVGAWRLAAANGIYNLNMIYAGQRLCIPSRW